MKFVFMALISSMMLSGFSAKAFINSAEHDRLVATMNQGFVGQAHFEDIRCSLRSRMCLVKMDIPAVPSKVGCMIEHIRDASDIITESANSNGDIQTELSPYAHDMIANCIEKMSRK